MKNINRQIEAVANNTNKVLLGEFNFSPKNILNKTQVFDSSIVGEETIMDRIIDAINNKNNDKFYIEHEPGSKHFMLRIEYGR